MKKIFTEIFLDNGWRNTESISGPGSTEQRVSVFIDELFLLLKAYDVKTLLDAPCGDFNWAWQLANVVEQYVGMDIVPQLITKLNKNKTFANRRFILGDLCKDELPKADFLICRDCLVHFSFRDVAKAINNFKSSKSRFLLTTTFVDRLKNEDIATGGWRPINLQKMPNR